jgi:glycosyltransferase involved in cell wall biosynthesis
MIICLVQISEQPTPVYDEIAQHLRLSGNEVWVTRLDQDGNILWDNGSGHLITQKASSYPLISTPNSRVVRAITSRLRQFNYGRLIRKMVLKLQPNIVQINSANMRFLYLIPVGGPKKTAFILDFRQIGDKRLSHNFGVRMYNDFRSIFRRATTVSFFEHSCYLHPSGAMKGLGSQWDRWGSVVPLGVNDSFLNWERTELNKSDNVSGVRFIYVGTLARQRKLETLIKAIRTAANKSSDFQFHFLGRDISDGFYRDLVKKLKLEQYIRFIPSVPYDEVPQLLGNYDVAVAYVPYEPTDWSYHPTLKILEYRALGIPIIATDVPPNREVVVSGSNGFLCDNSAEDFATAMLRLIDNRQLLKKIKDQADLMRTGVTWSDVARIYEGLYTDLLSSQNG